MVSPLLRHFAYGDWAPLRLIQQEIVRLTGFEGQIRWDSSKPDGQPRRSLDTSRAKELFGFEAKTSLDEGLKETVKWYTTSRAEKTGRSLV